jgi:transcriptional regulator with XRE-family HTH domain
MIQDFLYYMQEQNSATAEDRTIWPYASFVPPKLKKSRPRRGAHLTALRTAAGLTQVELANAIGETQQNVAYWEQSEYPPRADVLPKLARTLGVRVEDVLDLETTSPARRPGPIGRAQKAFEKVARLPRRQQDKIIEMVEALVAQVERRAS